MREEIGPNDYVDGILFSKNHGVVITGSLTDEKPADVKPQTFSGPWDPWFYLHVKERTQHPPSTSPASAPSASRPETRGQHRLCPPSTFQVRPWWILGRSRCLPLLLDGSIQ